MNRRELLKAIAVAPIVGVSLPKKECGIDTNRPVRWENYYLDCQCYTMYTSEEVLRKLEEVIKKTKFQPPLWSAKSYMLRKAKQARYL